MIKNHIKVAFRTLGKNKVYSLINILGLTIGLAACMLVATVVIDDLSYDKFWKRSDDLYKVNMINKMADGLYDKQSYSYSGLGAALADQFPELENYTALDVFDQHLRKNEGDQDVISVKGIRGDSSLLEMLDFEIITKGKPPFVAGKTNLFITESFRDLHFPEEDPVGKLLYWGTSQTEPELIITAVIKDIPHNTHLRAQVIAFTERTKQELSKEGFGSMNKNYFLLRSGTSPILFANKVNGWLADYMTGSRVQEIELQSIKDIYLHSEFDEHLEVKSTVQTVYIFSAVGALLLIIACINFINLSTARALKRLKETGVRKILGAKRGELVMQFLVESFLFFSISITLACILYVLSIQPLQNFIGHQLAFTFISSVSPLFLLLVSVLILSVLSGLYPAWLLSGFKPANSLKGKLINNTGFVSNWVRQSLVVLQFTLAIVVMVALLVVDQQLTYLGKKDLGYDRENLLYTGRVSWDGKSEAFKTELKKIAGVEAVSIAGWDPSSGGGNMYNTFDHPLKEGEKFKANFILADFDFPQTMKLKLKEGRFLDSQYGNDFYSMDSTWGMSKEKYEVYRDSRSLITTNSTAKMLGIDSLGHLIRNVGFRTAGIIADFHNESLHHVAGPLFILAQQDAGRGADPMFIRIASGNGKKTIPAITSLWKQFYPDRVLDIKWVSDILALQYEAEQKQRTLFVFFSNLMLFVSALGVFGLIVHAAEQRVKEIGIRKVLGASVTGIVKMLSGDFVKLVFIAIFIASPIAWWAMNKWLQDFAYRIDIEWWMFALAGMMAIVVAIFTGAMQAVKAAVANPVESLRDE